MLQITQISDYDVMIEGRELPVNSFTIREQDVRGVVVKRDGWSKQYINDVRQATYGVNEPATLRIEGPQYSGAFEVSTVEIDKHVDGNAYLECVFHVRDRDETFYEDTELKEFDRGED